MGCPDEALGDHREPFEADLEPSLVHQPGLRPLQRTAVGAPRRFPTSQPMAAPVERARQCLPRPYFPERTDLSVHSRADLEDVAFLRNVRPGGSLVFSKQSGKLNVLLSEHGDAATA